MAMTDAQLAHEAQNIRQNEAFQRALDAMRTSALEGLVRVPATDTEEIRDLQAIVRVVDDLRGHLEAYIRAAEPKRKPGIV
jgi:hypothetical protein